MEGLENIDFRGIPTHECPICESRLFKIVASFDEYNIALWLTEGECANCGLKLTVPTPVDDPNYSPD
jgi:C4-type Zn-finger protein